ncbi:hypothetical protein [Hymenobacter guriensis]|uniref:Uncharacterized protein n=1 Tax=Hymenobacter guriensis TaxID=2793065 RepID=A0ABS0L952_9BACT|nr:hypothetical protein [Hymenobacter guriensis]MBG8556138.1 hypothetical protein [Hymenobacter guriensis]
MSSTSKRDFTAKTARPVLDANSLYGLDELPLANTPAKAPVAEATVVPSPEASGQDWVQFSSYLRRQTYLRLKQAEYWEPGFVVRHRIEQVVSELLDSLEGANRALPEDEYQKLLQKNKKLKP